ncbi:MAG: malto-oligosyltrehalose synthase, partial [Candidatus Dormibacteraeota bacterium]|nr:malto-oligosyltrehalose synthase [Candidatus Dormibacteraeota bacterium]
TTDARHLPDRLRFIARFQQTTGPVMAKGTEDTAFYQYNRLISLNEVGGDPDEFGRSLTAFHRHNAEMARDWSGTQLTSSTHDTKRSEDVRARLSLLAQVPDQWAAAISRWSKLNRRHRRGAVPDRNAEYLLYQTLVGAWPLREDRAVAYMEKAAREARRHTTWTDPQPGYEEALRAFVSAVSRDPEFQADLQAFAEPLVAPGRAVSLAMTLVKLTAPGIPDTYQGSELWDLSLVDPDNRRPIDYGARREFLRQLNDDAATRSPVPGPALTGDAAGLTKLHVTTQALRLRRTLAPAFDGGSTYCALEVAGPGADNVLAFARGTIEDPLQVVVAVPRLDLRREPGWAAATTIALGPGEWVSQLEGHAVTGPAPSFTELRGRLPVALLRRDG